MDKKASLNHVYRLVWSDSLGCFVPVAEHANARGKRSCGAAAVLAAALALGAPAFAAELLTGGSVVAGSGTISQSASSLTVQQDSAKLAIDWQSFSIGQGASVTFVQPAASAVALNRVLGSDVSVIQGALNANGQVFLINPNGVLFTPTAQVNVGGLVASTLSLSTEDFLAGRYTFAGESSNAVVNQGSITAAGGGTIALIAAKVTNTGSLVAGGSVLLGAGSRVTLDLGGPVKIEVEQGAIDALIEQGGAIRADGGTVYLTAKAAGDLATTVINHTGITQARTRATGEQGQIVLLGGMESDRIVVGGTLDASAPNGGNGGFIETSAAQVSVASGAQVTTLAAAGTTGTWLIDPTDFTVSAGSASQSDSGIGADTLNANLATTSVTLETTSSGSEAGDINGNAAVGWSANTTLTLNAHGDINVNAAITATGDSAGLVLNYGGYLQNGGTVASGSDYYVNAPITLSGSNASLAINGNAYTLIHSMAELDAIDSTGLSGRYALAQDLDASGTTYTSALVGTSNTSAFTGTFAGLGHTVSNLTISSSGNYVGLFGYNSGTIRDVGLEGGSVSGNDRVGALVGNNDGTVSNAYATGSVSGSWAVGGLVGSNTGTIDDAYATGDVSSSSASVGGLVGWNNGTVTDAYATGNVTGSDYVGGLVGYNASGTISDAYATGNVSASSSYAGGLVGYNSGTISNTYAIGSVSASGTYSYAGGLVGVNDGGISNAYATGSVSASSTSNLSYAGGLVGYNYGSISNAYATGSVSASGASRNYAGGLVGYNSYGTITASFWNTDAIATGIGGGTSSSGATGKTLAELQTLSTFTDAGWDIDDAGGTGAVWRIYDGSTTPLLRSFLTALTLSADSAGKTYDGTAASGTLSAATGDGSAVDASLLLGSTAYATTGKNAGTYSAADGTLTTGTAYSTQQGYDISYADDLSVTITPKEISATATAQSKTYDGTTAAAVSGTLSGAVAGDDVAVSGSGSFSDKNVGTGKTVAVSLSGADAGNYTLAADTATATADIYAKAITASLTAAGKTYDGTTAAAVSGTLSGTVAGDDVAVSGSGSFSDKNVGTSKTVSVSGTLSGTDAGNYTLAANGTTTADITPKEVTAALTAASKTYDGTTDATVSGSLSGTIAGDDVAVSGSGSFGDKNVGTAKTVAVAGALSGTDAGNYTLATNATTTADITPKEVTAALTAASKTYDGTTDASVSGSLSGTVAGDDVALSGSGSFSDKNVGTGKTVAVAGSLSGADAGNYTLAANSATTADITPKEVTAALTAADKVYDGTTDAAVSGSLSGTVAGDDVALAGTGAFADGNAGTDKTVAVSGTLSGADAGNYVLTANGTATATIERASLTVTAGDAGKTYGQTASLTAFATSGLVAGDAVSSVNLASAGAASTATVGSYTITASGADGTGLSNYAITYADGTLTVHKAGLTITASDAAKLYGETAVLSGYTAAGLVNGDSVSSVRLASAGAASSATVGRYTITASDAAGSGLSNYDIAYADGVLTVRTAIAADERRDAAIRSAQELTVRTADAQGRLVRERRTAAASSSPAGAAPAEAIGPGEVIDGGIRLPAGPLAGAGVQVQRF